MNIRRGDGKRRVKSAEGVLRRRHKKRRLLEATSSSPTLARRPFQELESGSWFRLIKSAFSLLFQAVRSRDSFHGISNFLTDFKHQRQGKISAFLLHFNISISFSAVRFRVYLHSELKCALASSTASDGAKNVFK